jgi:hypothetical protein
MSIPKIALGQKALILAAELDGKTQGQAEHQSPPHCRSPTLYGQIDLYICIGFNDWGT